MANIRVMPDSNCTPEERERQAQEVRRAILPLLKGIRQEVIQLRDELKSLRTNQDQDVLLTKKEVADWLNVSVRTVDTLAASGEIRKVAVRGCVRFSPGAVEAYIRRAAEGRAER